jgi:DNA invertase Pin-like site-specific DNA recombinase
MLLQILGSFAEFERELLRTRVRAGLANARRKGKQLGRPRIEIDVDEARGLRAQGLSYQAIATRLEVSLGKIHGVLNKP